MDSVTREIVQDALGLGIENKIAPSVEIKTKIAALKEAYSTLQSMGCKSGDKNLVEIRKAVTELSKQLAQ